MDFSRAFSTLFFWNVTTRVTHCKTSRAKHTKRDMSTDSSPKSVQRGQSCLSFDRVHDSASDSASNSRLLQQAENLDAIYQAYSRPEVCSTADVESPKSKWQAAALARADARNLSDEKLPESHGRDWQFGDSEASFSSTLRSMELQVEASILSDLDSKVAAPPDPKGNSEAQEPQCATHCETTLCGRAATEKSCPSRTKIAAPAPSLGECIFGLPIHTAENKRARIMMDTQQTLDFADPVSKFNMISSAIPRVTPVAPSLSLGCSVASFNLNVPFTRRHCTRRDKLCSSMDGNLPAEELEAFTRLQRERIQAAGRSSSLNCNLHSPLFEFGEMLNELNQLEEAEMVDGSFANDHFKASLSRADDASQIQPSGRVRRTRLQSPIGHNIESDSDDECATANSYLDTETQFWASNQRRVAYNRWMGGLDLSK